MQFPVHGILPSDVKDVSTEVEQPVLKLSHKLILCYSYFLFDCNSGDITTILMTHLLKGALSLIYLFVLRGSEECTRSHLAFFALDTCTLLFCHIAHSGISHFLHIFGSKDDK